jgi:hypothetical protein
MLLMLFCRISARAGAAVLTCISLIAGSLAFAADSKSNAKHKGEAGPDPAARIDVAPFGYIAPSRFYLIARLSSASLDFIDNGHLLFTFREGGLIQRLPGDPKDDEDQIVHALVLDIATGKVAHETSWRMHDRQGYLWAIGQGQFLVRQRNALYLTDSRLELRPYMQFSTPLQALTVSPDHKLLMIEAEKDDASDEAKDGPPPAVEIKRPSTQILMIRLQDHTVIARSETRHPVDVPLLTNSFLEVFEGNRPDKWVIRDKPFTGQPSMVTELKSACDPAVSTLSDHVFLAAVCPGGSSDHLVTAYSTMGTILWQDRWQARYIWPTFQFAENGSRFAYSSLEIDHSVGTMDPIGEDDVQAQMVGVFDTATGKLALVKAASPVLSAGHNYALSADGSRFAILREGAIEVYNLPPAPTTDASSMKAAAK